MEVDHLIRTSTLTKQAKTLYKPTLNIIPSDKASKGEHNMPSIPCSDKFTSACLAACPTPWSLVLGGDCWVGLQDV